MNKNLGKLGASEKQILDQTFKAISDSIITAKKSEVTLLESLDKKNPNDFIAEVKIDSVRLKYLVEIKGKITKADKVMLSMPGNDYRLPRIILTSYVNPEMADELKLAGIEFADTAGNIFLNQPPVFIFIKGNKLKDAGKLSIKRAFKTTGLKIIFALLITPGLENATYREIAGAAGVSLGSVDYAIADLKDLGFLCRQGNGKLFLTRREDLIKRWVQSYSEQLRPKLVLGTFTGPEGWWKNGKVSPFPGLWGGEIAACKMTDYLSPEIVTIYVDSHNLSQVLLENRLRKDPEGKVEILEEFWPVEEKRRENDLVHPLLVYADLVASGDPRNAEVAEMIYERHIIKSIRQS